MSLGDIAAEKLSSEAVSATGERVARRRSRNAPANAVPRNFRREQSLVDFNFNMFGDSTREGVSKPVRTSDRSLRALPLCFLSLTLRPFEPAPSRRQDVYCIWT